jgi:hypothetical protein
MFTINYFDLNTMVDYNRPYQEFIDGRFVEISVDEAKNIKRHSIREHAFSIIEKQVDWPLNNKLDPNYHYGLYVSSAGRVFWHRYNEKHVVNQTDVIRELYDLEDNLLHVMTIPGSIKNTYILRVNISIFINTSPSNFFLDEK